MKNELTEFDIANDSEFLVIQEAAEQFEFASDPNIAIHNILSLCSRLMGLNRGRVFLRQDDTEYLYAAYSYGLTESETERSRFALNEGITGKVMHSARAVVIPDIDKEDEYLFRTVDRETLPDEPVSFLAVPILRKKVPIGVVTFNRLKNRNRKYDRDLAFIKIISLLIGEILVINQVLQKQTQSLKAENEQLRNLALGQGSQYGIIGESAALLQALDKVTRAAHTPVTVMLKGESGTGKEKFSRMIHRASNRKDGPFIAINCAAIPQELLESELFGYEKGGFTGATKQKKGKFELAHNGTLFLDEIGDFDFSLQAKLLRVLEDKSISRIGGNQEVPIDVRIIVASHKDLYKAVNEQKFRLDLFYRLNVFPIDLPALRERDGDIRLLTQHFLNQANQDYLANALLETQAWHFLETYSWPGNIRQLENVIKRAVLMAEDGFINQHLIQSILSDESAIQHNSNPAPIPTPQPTPSFEVPQHSPAKTTPNMPPQNFPPVMEDDTTRNYWKVSPDQKTELLTALKHAKGNKTRAAKSLNMTPRQFNYRMKKLGLE